MTNEKMHLFADQRLYGKICHPKSKCALLKIPLKLHMMCGNCLKFMNSQAYYISVTSINLTICPFFGYFSILSYVQATSILPKSRYCVRNPLLKSIIKHSKLEKFSSSTFNQFNVRTYTGSINVMWLRYYFILIGWLILSSSDFVRCKSFKMIQGLDNPIFVKEKSYFYGYNDYAVLSIQVNFTDLHHKCKFLIRKFKSEFSWSNRMRKIGNNSFALIENKDALIKVESYMRYVQKKVELINGSTTSKRDIMSLMF